MSLMTSPVALKARSVARTFGFGNIMMRRQRAAGYEQALASAMRQAVKPRDVVWDVGANVGFYTQQFAAWTGHAGQIYAFEPDTVTLIGLRAAVDTLANVTVVPVGLSAADECLPFARLDTNGARSRIVPPSEAHDLIEVRAADSLQIPPPNVMKVDVEGHELDVLRGATRLLNMPIVRDLFVEVHFAIFASRNQSEAPAKIERMLKFFGFRLRWVDPSHLHASRAT